MRPMTTLAAVFGALALAAAPAQARCLDARDLSRGVLVTYANGDITTMRRGADGYVQVDEVYADGSPAMRYRAHRGIYFVEEFQVGADGKPVEGTGLQVVFPVDPADLPDPAPGAIWTGHTVNVFDDGTERPEATGATFAEAPPLTLGDCSYDALAVELRYDWGADGGMTLDYLYLTGVGAGIIVAKQFDGDKVSTSVPVGLDVVMK